jgi:hypothetical protein
MATTTNYGWTTPDDTALVKDGAAAIRTLGSSVDTTTKALNPSTTLGDIEYRSSTANTNTRLPIGTTDQVLKVSGGVPTWGSVSASPTSASATVGTQQSTSSTSYTNLATSGPAVTLTTGTKVLVIVSCANGSTSVDNEVGTMDFEVSGATTRSATDATMLSLHNQGSTSPYLPRASSVSFLTVTAGSNTFTAKYRSRGGGSIAFNNREITVIDLGS